MNNTQSEAETRKYFQEDFQHLLGTTIVAIDAVKDEFSDEFFPVLCLRTAEGAQFGVLVGRDQEMNGPGWLETCQVETVTK